MRENLLEKNRSCGGDGGEVLSGTSPKPVKAG